MQQDTCMFWKKHGQRCCNKIFSLNNYCKLHKKKNKYIFEIMQRIKCEEDIYEILKYIYDNDTYDIEGKQVKNDMQNKKELFINIIDYLMSNTKLTQIIHKMLIPVSYSKQQNMANLHKVLYNTYEMSNETQIVRIQSWIRKKLYKIITQYNTEKAENCEDPFTFDDINEISECNKFSYKDCHGRVYVFNAVEFEYFVRKNGKWNPYTKEPLPDYVVKHLRILMQYNRLNKKNDSEWQTNLHAFTEVSQLMEKMGFYNDVTWFDKLTFTICKNVIKVYRDMSANISEGPVYFPIDFEISQKHYVFEFCKEVIRLFKEADDHYLLCCNFVKALALNIDEFYNNLPNWLLNVESPINFLNNNNNLFMYVQSLIDNITYLEHTNLQGNIIDDDQVYAANIRYIYR
jgi:hypothetical protein